MLLEVSVYQDYLTLVSEIFGLRTSKLKLAMLDNKFVLVYGDERSNLEQLIIHKLTNRDPDTILHNIDTVS